MYNRSSHLRKVGENMLINGSHFWDYGVVNSRVDAKGGAPPGKSLWGSRPLGNYRNLAAKSDMRVEFLYF